MSAPRRDRWCHHVDPVAAEVACSGTTHRLEWRRGKLVLTDHDLGAERAMLAFGGEMPACLATLQTWRNLHTWAMASELYHQMQARLDGDALLGPGALGEAHRLGLALTWERAWSRTEYLSQHGRLLSEVLRDLATPAVRQHLRHWMRERGSRRLSSVRVAAARRDEPVSIDGVMDSVGVRAVATLSARWLTGVWARGLAVVDGGLVVDLDPPSPGAGSGTAPAALRVRAVRWDPDPGEAGVSRPVTAPAVVVRAPAGSPALRWEG